MEAVCDAIGENYIDVINNQLFQVFCNIYSNYIPTFPVECEFFKLTITPDIKFTGIHKVLDCFQLQLNDFHNFKGGGLLSLLKLNPSTTVRLSINGKMYPELASAWNIIQTYLSSKNRDLVACQRKLIEKDLDEYAEL
jgi:hypothetical protein